LSQRSPSELGEMFNELAVARVTAWTTIKN
jgi:hypothetical protein